MGIWQDVRLAGRLLLKNRWFTLAVITVLTLGIGANAAVFTIVNAVLLRGLPFDNADRIVVLGGRDPRGRLYGVSFPDFEDWQRAQPRSFASMTATVLNTRTIADEEHAPEQHVGTYIGIGLFRHLNVHVAAGRDFRPEDDQPGAPPTIILSDTLWKARYAGDPAVIGKTLRVQGAPVTVIGIMPADMRFPPNSDYWIPLSQYQGQDRARRDVRIWLTIGVLAEGTTLAQAEAELSAISNRLAREFPETNKDVTATVEPFLTRMLGPLPTIFWSMMGAVGFVLLIACANVANLLLARATYRSREISVRLALGASRWRIVRQLLVESVIVAVISGILGLAFSLIVIRWFEGALTDFYRPYFMTFTLDPLVFAFTAAVSVGTGLIFGVAPALHASSANVNDVLKEGGRGGGPGMRARRWTGALLVGQLALTLVLLSGAGFMIRSFLTIQRIDPGVDASRILTALIRMPSSRFRTSEARLTFMTQVEERLAGVAAFQGATVASHGPMMGAFSHQVSVDEQLPLTGGQQQNVSVVFVGPRYFDTLGLKPTRGRRFESVDGLPGREVAVVNQRFVEMYFAQADPVGRRIRLKDDAGVGTIKELPATTIVGVVSNVRQRLDPQQPAFDPVVYLPLRLEQQSGGGVALIVRAAANPANLAPVLREEMRKLDPDGALFGVMTASDALANWSWRYRMFGPLFGLFALIALVLSAVGLYGVTAYSVTQRSQEFGVRMALGAQPRDVWWLVTRQGLFHLAIGLLLGTAGAIATGRLIQSWLFQTSSTDPATLAGIGVLLIVVALSASFLPAYRSTRISPAVALRHE